MEYYFMNTWVTLLIVYKMPDLDSYPIVVFKVAKYNRNNYSDIDKFRQEKWTELILFALHEFLIPSWSVHKIPVNMPTEKY